MTNYQKIEEINAEISVVKKQIAEILIKDAPGCIMMAKDKMSYIDRLIKDAEELLYNTNLDDNYKPSLIEQIFDDAK
jgi:hypothetical protein